MGVLEYRVARSYYELVNSCNKVDLEGKVKGEKMGRGKTPHVAHGKGLVKR